MELQLPGRTSRGRVLTLVAAAVAMVVAAVVIEVRVRHESIRARTYRVGADHSPPYYFLRPDGVIEGLGVDVLNEAARRSGVRLQWVAVPDRLDDAFLRGDVDLWPAVAGTPERRASLHLTEPWLRNNYCLISRSESGIRRPRDTTGRPVAWRSSGIINNLASNVIPGAIFVFKDSRFDAVQAVCLGSAVAAFVEVRFVDTVLLRRPPGCESVHFHIDVVNGTATGLSIMSTQGAAGAADLLRASISDAALDGTLSAMLEKWATLSSVDARSVYALQDAERRNVFFTWGLLCAVLVTAALVLQTLSIKAAHRRARTSQEAAETASAAKSEFLANMSHEIRTPLSGVIGMTNAALDGPLTEDKREDLVMVRDSAESLLSIINDVLDFSKMEAGRMTIEYSAFNLEEMLNSVLNLFAAGAEEKDLSLRLDFPQTLPRSFHGGAGRLRQIMVNFVGNAVKFTRCGEIRMVVEEASRSGGEARMRLSVHDTGIGIPPEMHHKLFTKFTQVDASSTRKYGGTGLGLAISKQLAELMGGTVGMTSQPGAGSTFWAELPLMVQAHGGLGPASERIGLPALSCARELCRPRLLVAEDSVVNQRVIFRMLTKLGWQVDLVANGLDAIHKWESETYNAILMDCQMPGMDGYQAAAAIRERERGSTHIPIIAVTAHAMTGDDEVCRRAGMDDYLTKPINSAALELTLIKHICRVCPREPELRQRQI